MEIGSIYEIDPQIIVPDAAYSISDFRLGEIEKYQKKYKRFTSSGREAIALALKSIDKNRPATKKVCLLPAYMCDSVFFPFKRAGWTIHFYHIQKNLQADHKNLFAQIEAIKPGLLFIHPYYGIDTWKSLRPFFKTWQSQDICIMEDVTQSYYLNNAAWEADYIIGSLRKWYPIPDGGFVVSNDPLPDEIPPENRKFAEEKLAVLTKKWSYLHDTGSLAEKKNLKSSYLQKNRALEEWLDDYDEISSLSKESMKILSLSNEKECRDRRNSNYQYLQERLIQHTQFTPIPFEKTNVDRLAASLYFPIYVKNRADLQSFLIRNDIFAPLLWPIGNENENCLTCEEHDIFDHILALPMDQRYGQSEMRRMVKVLTQYERENPKSGSEWVPEAEIIAIRADANDIIATGHIMRCITIAKQLQARGKRVLFFTADEYPHKMLEQAGMEFICLHTSWNQMEAETAILSQELIKYGCKKLLVDSYQVTENYFDSLKNICKIIYIDDCFHAVYPVNMVINYNAYHVRFPYKEAYKKNATLLLGTTYVPLRDEFQMLHPHDTSLQRASDAEGHILVNSGGGDIYNALYGILLGAMTRAESSRNIFHVIVGSFNKNKEQLEHLAQKHPNIRLHYNVTHMAELMQQCDIAISAAGTMLFELCAMQIPTTFYVCADNQQYDSDFFAQEDRMLFSGDIRTNREECIANILKNVDTLFTNKEMQQQMKHRLHEVTDGKGAQRIAEEIIKLK